MKMRSLVDFGYIEQVISENPARENPWKCSFMFFINDCQFTMSLSSLIVMC